MIRMGRSSKDEENSKETSALHERSSTTAFPHDAAESDTRNRAVTESESMARDIKEGRLSGFVGAGTVLTGETDFQSMLRVDGHLTGRVASSEGTLIIGSTGQVDADIEVSSAIVNGAVNGDVVATEKLELGRTARVVGNIKTPRLLMEDGAILEGSCSMVQSKESMESRLEEQRRKFTTTDLTTAEGDEEAVETNENDESGEEDPLVVSGGYDDLADEESIDEEDEDVEAKVEDESTADAAVT